MQNNIFNKTLKVLKFQGWHFLSLVLLLTCVCLIVENQKFFAWDSFLGVSTRSWFILAIVVPILHQFYVLLCWRLELYYKVLTKAFGSNAFKIYKVFFTILILLRFVSILGLAISDRGSMNVNIWWAYCLALVLMVPVIYLFYSVKKYFGIDRAFGIDHFFPDKMKNLPLVRKGIFKYTSNGMYLFGFLVLWIPGLLWLSQSALLVAGFNYLYIWSHYYFTELPDLKEIY